MNLTFKKITISTIAAAGLLTAVQSNAQLTFTGSGSDGDGSFTAQVTFFLSGDQLTIDLENTTSQGLTTWAAGQLISGLSFNVSGANGFALDSGTGNTTSFPDPSKNAGPFNYTVSSGTDILPNWAITSSSATFVNFNDLGGGKPQYLIIGPDSADTVNGTGQYNINSSVYQHQPVVLGTATFVMTVTNITSLNEITNVLFNFGTSSGEGTAPGIPVPVPESATILSAALMLVPLSVQLIRKGWKRSQPKTD